MGPLFWLSAAIALPLVFIFSFGVIVGDNFTLNMIFQIGVGICKEIQTSIYIAE